MMMFGMVVVFVRMLVVVLMMLVVVLVMMLVRVVVQVLVLLRAVHGHGHVGAGDAAFHGGRSVVFHAGDAECVQRREGGIAIRTELQQGGSQHIARRTHGAVEIQGLHGFASM